MTPPPGANPQGGSRMGYNKLERAAFRAVIVLELIAAVVLIAKMARIL